MESEATGYFRHARQLRETYATYRRQDVIDAFESKAESARRRARSAQRSGRIARFLQFDPHMAAFFQAHVDVATAEAKQAEAQAAAMKDPAWRPPPGTVTDVGPQHWHRANEDRGRLAPGGVSSGNRSVLTGTDHPPSIDGTRRYGTRAGLREPLAQHQVDLERAVPRDGNGDPVRGADPRAPYFQLVNDGGPTADPTRGINCQDCVLSFFDTYVHGRPRVSAPRTFDAYGEGDSTRPLYGEDIGPERVEHATGGRFQSLCPIVAGEPPAVAGQRVQQALGDVSAQLLAGGHGSFAFLVNAWEGGSAHAWAAVNNNGQILFVDPQSGLVAPPGTSLYGHLGSPNAANVIAVDALVVDGGGNPMPFNGRPDGLWRPKQTTLPPPPPRPAPIYYSSSYQQTTPQPSPSLAPSPTPAPGPAPGPLPAPDPAPAPSPAPDPAPVPSPSPSPAPAPSPQPTPPPTPSPSPRQTLAPEPSPGPDLLSQPPTPRVESPDVLLADDLGEIGRADSLPPFEPQPGPDPRPGPTPPGPTPPVPAPPVPAPEPEPSVTPKPAPKPIPSPRRPVDLIAEALAPRPAPVDRIAEALAPRDNPRSSRPPNQDIPRDGHEPPPDTTTRQPDPVPDLAAADPKIDRALESGTPERSQAAEIDPERAQRLEQARQNEHDARQRKSYREYLEHARTTHEDNRRAEYADYLSRIADGQRTKVLGLGMQADAAFAAGSVLLGEHLRAEARRTSQDADDLETKARQVRTGAFAPERVDVELADWIRINDDVGTLAMGGVDTGDQSALTGDDGPPPIDRSRPYGKRGGLRAPLAVHQADLENAMPRDADGRVSRLADPRIGSWFRLANDGGPAADPTRGINCVDGLLSLYETYVHGRPRVSAPRTFDSYAHGDPTRPLGAEEYGLARIEDTVRGEFQGLCPYVGGLSPQQAKQAVDTAMTNLHNHLYNAGHGAFAFIVTDSEEGTAHAWAAINQNGTILFLDPQTGHLSEESPLYAHTGEKNDGNVISMDAVVVDGQGRPTPLPYHKPGLWSRSYLEPTGAGPENADNNANDPDPRDTSGPDAGNAGETIERSNPPIDGEGRGSEGLNARPATPIADLAGTSSDDENETRLSSTPHTKGVGSQGDNGPTPGSPVEDGPSGQEPLAAHPPQPPNAPESEETPARAAERLVLQTLTKPQQRVLEASINQSNRVAERELSRLREIAASLTGPDGAVQARIVDDAYKVKSLESLARKFQERSASSGISASRFLKLSNDRVRFSILLPEQGYGRAVENALGKLRSQGYEVLEVASFWGDGRGRHNGLNVTLKNPDGFRMEVQFPTELSRSVGKNTHDLYETVRSTSRIISGADRVEAFLAIIGVTKSAGMPTHQPDDLDVIENLVQVDTSFQRWAGGKARSLWQEYCDFLEERNVTLDQALATWGLTVEDVPGIERLVPANDRSDVRLSGVPGVEGLRQGDEPDRLQGTGSGTAGSSDLARGPEEVDLRPSDRGRPAVRRHLPRRDDVGRSVNGGGDGAGSSAVQPSERRDSSGDDRRGREDGLGLRPAAAAGEVVATNAGEVVINALVGQRLAALGEDFALGAHYLDLFEYDHERRQAERLGESYDVRALEAAHGRTDGLGNPDVIVRVSDTDLGAYGDLKRLDPDLRPDRRDADYSRRVEKRLREPFGQDARITVAVVDGREVGLTIDAAVRGIRRALGFWRQQGREVLPEQRMIVFTGDGGSVVWRGDTGDINVSA